MTVQVQRVLAIMAATVGLALSACTTNPATGRSDFTPLMGPSQELAIGAEEHPKLLEAFGGAYDERAALTAYVNELGQRLQGVSETPSPPFTFTIVNSDEINAFALPGGYVYVTRGLMALANSEAELAGVIAHEIGHVTARHTAQRYNQAVFAQLGAAVLSAATGSRAVSELARFGVAAYVQGYSRDQEHEADELGVRYLGRAGYDPRAMAVFLSKMGAQSRLAARIAGRQGVEAEASLFSSHPRTAERVARAAEAAQINQAAGRELGRDEYLLRLAKTLYGDDADQGFRRGREFAHPGLGFRFKVPPDFRMRNTSQAVVATHKGGTAIRFDGAKVAADTDMLRYLTRDWLGDMRLADTERITVNGMAAATASARINTRDGRRDLRAVVIRYDAETAYRFLILTPANQTAALAEELRRMTYSFRPLSEREKGNLRPQRIVIHEVQAGDTVASLADTMPFDDFKEERFRVLNGLGQNETLEPGRLVKLIGL
jgi:predicted Zn-dependent protease